MRDGANNWRGRIARPINGHEVSHPLPKETFEISLKPLPKTVHKKYIAQINNEEQSGDEDRKLLKTIQMQP